MMIRFVGCTHASSKRLLCLSRFHGMSSSVLKSAGGIRTAKSLSSSDNRSGKIRCSSGISSKSNNNLFHGVWPIIATPFKSDETIDYKAFERIIGFFCNEVGVNGCTILGILGESNRLLDEERKELITIATGVSNNNKTPICVGTSHSSTYGTMKLSEQAIDCGAQSVMITPTRESFANNQDLIIQYYSKIYQGLGDDVPLVLQDHPASTMVHMNMNTMKAILEQCPSIQCIKLESLPSPPKIRDLVPWMKENINDRSISILSGLGALYGIFDLECGTDGFMTGFAFPEILYALYEQQVVHKNSHKARLLYQQYLPLIVFEQQPGIAVRKEIYKLRGIMDSTHLRHPGRNSTDEATLQQLKSCIEFVMKRGDLDTIDLTKKILI